MSQIYNFLSKYNIIEILNKSDNIIYLNDSSLDFAIKFKPIFFHTILELVIENIPQHHYFFDPNHGWCFTITAEGYLDFGYAYV